MKILKQERIPIQSGAAFILNKGQFLKVIDPEGGQVSDLACFTKDNISEWISSGRTFDYNNKIYLTTNDILYSNRSNKMLTIVEDTVGKHDFLLTPCSPETFEIIYGEHDHRSCLMNLYDNLKEYGISKDQIPTTLNIFMNVNVAPDGKIAIDPPPSKAGDYIIFRAEMDLVVGLTACSAEITNNYKLSPIDYELYED